MNLKSKTEARKVIEKLFPKKEARDAYLKMFKEAITEARSHGEEKWGVSLHEDRVRLIIGYPVVCTLHKGYIWFVIPGEAYPDYSSPKEIPGWDTDSFEYKSISSIAGDYHYSKDYQKEAWPQIREQNFKFMELVAQKYKKLHSKPLEKHSPGVLKYLGMPDRDVNRVVKGREPITKKPPRFKTGSFTVNSFKSVIKDINLLKKDRSHTEKAHEVLVASFYEKLGYESFTDIKYQINKIDIAIQTKKRTLIVNEVKRSWYLSDNMEKALEQAYLYALKVGAKYAVITNGDYYAIYDRDKGRSYKDHFIGDFRLTELTKEKLDLIKILMKK